MVGPLKAHLYVYNIILNSSCYEIHQQTFNYNQIMDMLKNDPSLDGVLLQHDST
jgi:hypothetical protein